MSITNSCTFIGRLTRDPDLKFIAGSGKAVCNVSVAVADEYDPKNSDKTYFVNAQLWGKSAEFAANYITKGELVAISGNMSTDKWEDKDGNKRSKDKLNAQAIKKLEWKDQDQQPRQTNQQSNNNMSGFQSVESDDDVPHSSFK